MQDESQDVASGTLCRAINELICVTSIEVKLFRRFLKARGLEDSIKVITNLAELLKSNAADCSNISPNPFKYWGGEGLRC